jgi:site-specific recombinase XerC
MFENFFDSPARVKALRSHPNDRLLEAFATNLHQKGYAEITARKHIRAAEHLMYWSDREGIHVSRLSEIFLERFDSHLHQCHCHGYGHSNRLHLLNGARLFLKHLRDTGIIITPVAEVTAQEPELLTAFYQWMLQQRGTSDSTLYNYRLPILELLKSLGENPGKFGAHNLRQFVLEKSQQCGWVAAKKCTKALRMFLRFLIADGKCATGLDAAIPVLAHWRLSSLPWYLQPEAVERIICSCDPSSPVGRRDRAILLFLARLAFRAGDVLQLHLSDIDWEGAVIHVSGKRHLSLVIVLCVERLTARCLLCWPALDYVCQKQYDCALKISPQMA